MTKIAYIRAIHSQQQQQQATSQPLKPISIPTRPPSIMLQPSIPSTMMIRPVFNNHRPTSSMKNSSATNCIPKPILMTPTTRFNSNPNILLGIDYQQEKNGGRISKPLMEKRRRARINQCLSQLKTIVVDDAGQLTKQNKCKLEKADILELTVNYVKKLHQQQQLRQTETELTNQQPQQEQFQAGFSECARQIFEFLNNLEDNSDEDLKIKIKDYLQKSLLMKIIKQDNKIDPESIPSISTNFPPSPTPSSESNQSQLNNQKSPSSSSSSSSSLITINRKRKFHQLTDEEASSTDNEDYFDYDYEDYPDDEDQDSNPFENNHHQQQPVDENHPLNLKIIPNHDNNSNDEDVWRPW